MFSACSIGRTAVVRSMRGVSELQPAAERVGVCCLPPCAGDGAADVGRPGAGGDVPQRGWRLAGAARRCCGGGHRGVWRQQGPAAQVCATGEPRGWPHYPGCSGWAVLAGQECRWCWWGASAGSAAVLSKFVCTAACYKHVQVAELGTTNGAWAQGEGLDLSQQAGAAG